MLVQFNTDESIAGREALGRHAEDVVRRALAHYSDAITRVEIHLSDVNAHKGGERDKRCLMEARLAGRQPIAVSDQASSLHQALDGAADKLRRAVDNALGKREDAKRSGARPASGEPISP